MNTTATHQTETATEQEPQRLSVCCQAPTSLYLLFTYCTECGEVCRVIEPHVLAF